MHQGTMCPSRMNSILTKNKSLFHVLFLINFSQQVLPGNTALRWVLLLSQLLQPQNAFSLNLKEGFVRWQPDVVHAFRVRDPQSGSLASCQEQGGHFTLRDAVQT